MTPAPANPAPTGADSSPEQPPGFQRRIVALLCFAVFFSVLNGTMFNVAVPDIAGDFRLSPTAASWVVSGFVLVFALGSVTYGKLADLYPVRSLISIGLLLFNCGSLLGFLSESYAGLLFARLVQAAGASAIPALAMYTATRFVPPAVRGRTLGAVSST
ncbi:MAG: MFS transporter, partial [Trichloromonadaceae bacterium]